MDFNLITKEEQVNCEKLKYSEFEQTDGKLVWVENVWKKNVVELFWSKSFVVKFLWKIFGEHFWRKCYI